MTIVLRITAREYKYTIPQSKIVQHLILSNLTKPANRESIPINKDLNKQEVGVIFA
jgi:hypothetical protein